MTNKTLDSTTITGNTTKLVGNILISDNGLDMIQFPTTARANIIYIVDENSTQTLYNKTLKNPNLRDSSTTYDLTVPTLSANAVIATQAWVNGKNYLTSHQ